MFVATKAQLDRARWPSTAKAHINGFMCSALCAGKNASKQRVAKYGTRMTPQQTAHHLVKKAIKRGEIKKPKTCARCKQNPGVNAGGRSKLHAHHEDYAKPLDIEWLCVDCHMAFSPRAAGEKNVNAKLSSKIVRRIKYGSYKTLPTRVLVAKLGVTKVTINYIRSGHTWRHV